jgi:hypothetical protein
MGLKHLLLDAHYKEDAERQVFMALNVCRFKPALYVPVVQRVKDSHTLCKNAKYTRELIRTLKRLERLPPIRYD